MTLADKFPPNEYICDGKIFLWYFEPTSHDILNPMPMVYQTPYARYIEPPAYGLLTSYPWYIEPHTHGILNLLPMVDRTSSLYLD